MTIKQYLNGFTAKDDRLGALSYFGSFAVFFTALFLAISLSEHGLIAAPLVIVTAFAGVRLYVLQHDCGHHSLFRHPRINDLAGYVLSPFTLTPYRAMQYNHNMHHAYLGNLDDRETTEILTLTLRGIRRIALRVEQDGAALVPGLPTGGPIELDYPF